MLSTADKRNIITDCIINACLAMGHGVPDQHFRIYAWRPGSDDVKLIFAIDDESAARIAVRARMDHNEMSEAEALEHVTCYDTLCCVDPDALFQGEAPLWDGLRSVGDSVDGT